MDAGVLLYFAIYVCQQLGIMLGIGAQTVLLCSHLVAVHRGETETLHDTQVHAARAALGGGLALVVCSGVAAIVLHMFSETPAVLLEPAFVFKWALIGAAVTLLFVQHWRVSSHWLLGLAGGVWYALFLVHSLAPVITWASIFVLFGTWMLFFGALWAVFVIVLSYSKVAKTMPVLKPVYTPPVVTAPASPVKPEPVMVAVVTPKPIVPKPVPPPPPKPVTPPAPAPVVVKPAPQVPKPAPVIAKLAAHQDALALPAPTWWSRLLGVFEHLLLSAAAHPKPVVEDKPVVVAAAPVPVKPIKPVMPTPAPKLVVVPLSPLPPVKVQTPVPPPAPKPEPVVASVSLDEPTPLNLTKLPNMLEHDEPLVPTPAPATNNAAVEEKPAEPTPAAQVPVGAVPGLRIMPRTPEDLSKHDRPALITEQQ